MNIIIAYLDDALDLLVQLRWYWFVANTFSAMVVWGICANLTERALGIHGSPIIWGLWVVPSIIIAHACWYGAFSLIRSRRDPLP